MPTRPPIRRIVKACVAQRKMAPSAVPETRHWLKPTCARTPFRTSAHRTGDEPIRFLLGALIGIAGVYIALAATYFNDLGYLSRVPVRYLLLTALGVPLTAAAAGWLLAGREPPAIARTVIE